MGSPPQVRGKPKEEIKEIAAKRITPAGAGKTRYFCVPAVFGKDHPRRCGENKQFPPQAQYVRGSPPQVRGKLSQSSTASRNARITPAGAGKTRHEYTAFAATKDHPRRCGENCRGRRNTPEIPGSPPQVRGKLSSNGTSSTIPGITPAGAGKTTFG